MRDIRDLIFCPLDMPPPPVVDKDIASAWIHTWDQIHAEVNHFRLPLQTYWNSAYPWEIGYVLHKNTAHKRDYYMHSFDVLFPELYEYFHTFPFLSVNHIGLMRQKYDVAVPLHSDSDAKEFCIRCYLWNDFDKNALYVRKTKDRLESRLQTVDGFEHVQSDKIYPTFPRRDYIPWMINSGTRAVHGVDAGGYGDRCAVVIGGTPDIHRLRDLIERSAEKYKEYALWW